MSEESSKIGVLVAVVFWLLILGGGAVAARKWLIPMFRQKERAEITRQTSSSGKYRQEICIAADAFSGYAILRSSEMDDRLKAQGIKLTVLDDKANYGERIRSLQAGDVSMAVFTIDSFIKAGSDLGDFPGVIVYLIDETRGADSILAYTNGVRNLADLNHKSARLVGTPDSPSEFLARIVVANFGLPQLSPKWWIAADGAGEVFRQFLAGNPTDRRAYVLWEPYVTKARAVPGAHVLVDSSQVKGFIVDVLVARREFLVQDCATVRAVVEAYACAAHAYSTQANHLIRRLVDDSRATGSEPLDRVAAEQVARGIQWKNTVENYAHFGLLAEGQAKGLEHVEDIITKVTQVLVKTGAIPEDPLKSRPNTLFFDKILRDMKDDLFHPGRGFDLATASVGLSVDVEQVRGDRELPALNDEEWNVLIPVGELSVEPISFARGTATINPAGEREIARLARALQSWPQYYVLVRGQARPEGDVEANKRLAQARADAALQLLAGERIGRNRIRTRALVATQGGGDAQSVVFAVYQKPY